MEFVITNAETLLFCGLMLFDVDICGIDLDQVFVRLHNMLLHVLHLHVLIVDLSL